MNRFARHPAGLSALVAGLAAAFTPGAAQPPAKGRPATTFVGVVPAEPPARVAIVVESDTFLAYACGQTDDFNRVASALRPATVRGCRALLSCGTGLPSTSRGS